MHVTVFKYDINFSLVTRPGASLNTYGMILWCDIVSVQCGGRPTTSSNSSGGAPSTPSIRDNLILVGSRASSWQGSYYSQELGFPYIAAHMLTGAGIHGEHPPLEFVPQAPQPGVELV